MKFKPKFKEKIVKEKHCSLQQAIRRHHCYWGRIKFIHAKYPLRRHRSNPVYLFQLNTVTQQVSKYLLIDNPGSTAQRSYDSIPIGFRRRIPRHRSAR